MTFNLSRAALLGVAFALTCPAHAQGPRATERGASVSKTNMENGKLAGEDRKFMETVARDNLTAAQAGKLAQSRSSNERVRKLGQMMEDDHDKANKDLQKIAESRSVTLPGHPDGSQEKLLRKLHGKSGAEFDQLFVQEAVKDHKKAQKLFEKTQKDAQDPDVKAFAERSLPAITAHLDMARSISSGGSANARAGN
ncbi:MAG TPA: DUF4142 domain-containing protein [Burkholderiales bacterium]|nr:DUF4142 domain-containing protein [Burkholderiales bacterium]